MNVATRLLYLTMGTRVQVGPMHDVATHGQHNGGLFRDDFKETGLASVMPRATVARYS